jgi:hypothetical protein
VKAWDPLSHNPYRLLGIPREQQPPASLSSAVVLACPGLEAVELTQALLQDCQQRLNSEQLPFYRATWFDSTRPLDQLAWLDICERRLSEAWRRWNTETHLLSQHNLAVLSHLRWMMEPDDFALWRECANRWRDLATLTQDPGYYQVITQFRAWQKEYAFVLLGRGDAARLRECWTVSVFLSSVEEIQAEQAEMLTAEIERWDLELAALRKGLLEGVSVQDVTRRFEGEMLPLAQFMQEATLDNLPLAAQFRKDLSLFYRALARAWWNVDSDSAKDYAEAWLDKAVELAPQDKRGEWRAELDHWRISRYPGEVRPVVSTLIPGDEARAPRRRLGAVLALLALLALIWAASHQRDPMAGLTRPAAQKRADEIVQEMSPLAERLSKMPAQIEQTQGSERKAMEEEQARMQQRHAALKGELVRIQKWLDRH